MVLGVLGLCFSHRILHYRYSCPSLILVITPTYLYNASNVSGILMKRVRICWGQVWGTGRKEGTHAFVNTGEWESIRVKPKTDVWYAKSHQLKYKSSIMNTLTCLKLQYNFILKYIWLHLEQLYKCSINNLHWKKEFLGFFWFYKHISLKETRYSKNLLETSQNHLILNCIRQKKHLQNIAPRKEI